METLNLSEYATEQKVNVKKRKKEAEKKEAQRKVRKIKVKLVLVGILITLLIIGVAIVTKKVTDWGAEHQLVAQRVIDVTVRWPLKVEARKPQVVMNPFTEKVVNEQLTPIEQRIIDKWGFKDGVVALAIFDCGESKLDQYAVSHTGDLGIAQINWPVWKKLVAERFSYNAADMFDVDKNLEVAYMVWDRADGEEGNKQGSWEAWVGFTSGAYTNCFK